MRYADDVIGLLGAYPGRRFKLAQIVRYIAGKHAAVARKNAVKQGVHLVLAQLEDAGLVEKQPAAVRGGTAWYWWRETELARA